MTGTPRPLAIIFAVLVALPMVAAISSAGPAAVSGRVIGTASIRAPAVILSNNTGSLTEFSLTVTSGDGIVSIVGPTYVGNSTIESAQTAAQYAASYLGMNFSNYNFTYDISAGTDNVSGPSGGAAMTMLAISALSGARLNTNFSMTGTISPNGTIGPIGGVYDKAAAVKAGGLSYFLVPKVPGSTIYSELYLLVQDRFGIPLIQVANVSGAYRFAFSTPPIPGNSSNYTFYTPINAASLPQAPISCGATCNVTLFERLTQFTMATLNSSLANLSAAPYFKNVSMQLSKEQAQNIAIASKGYLYGAANQAFQEYGDSTMFNSYWMSITDGYSALSDIKYGCFSLGPQQLTSKNYEYVIGGELRQSWGEQYITSVLDSYNSSAETTDDVLFYMKESAAAAGWCSAAGEMYSIGTGPGAAGTDVVPSQSLAAVASQRIQRAERYGNNQYLVTAKDAMSVNNYPLAIIGADYAWALNNATESSINMTDSGLLQASDSMARNSTFGVWATQFANEAELYIYESRSATNASLSRSYATSAYSAALLASQLSSDMKLINSSLQPGSGFQEVNSAGQPATNSSVSSANTDAAVYQLALTLQESLSQIFDAIIILVAMMLSFMILVLYMLTKIIYSTRSGRGAGAAGASAARRRRKVQ